MLARRGLWINLGILIALFTVSVLVRLPNLNKPLGQSSEWLTAHTLITHQVWDQKGISDSHFAPIYTYQNPGDKFIESLGGLHDENLDCYYVSYPPFGFILPYAVFKTLQVEPDVLPIQIFGLALHFIAVLFIVLLFYEMFDKRFTKHLFLPAFIAALVYLFSPAPLYYHANVYFVDMLVQIFFIVNIYLLIRILRKGIRKGLLIALGILNFLAVYTEWLAVFFAFVAFIISTIYYFRSRKFSVPIVIAVTTLSSLGLTLYQYSHITDFETYKEVSLNKFNQRSGHGENSEGFSVNDQTSFDLLSEHYIEGYRVTLHFTKIAVPLLLILLIIRRFKGVFREREWMALLLIALPIAMHHLVFFNFTALHEFAVLKTGLLFAFFIGLVMHYLVEQIRIWTPRYFGLVWIPILIGLFFFVKDNIRFYRQHRQQPYSTVLMDVGNLAAELAGPDDTIYTFYWYNAPEALFYAKRNIFGVENIEMAREYMRVRSDKRGIWIEIDPVNRRIVRSEIIYPDTVTD